MARQPSLPRRFLCAPFKEPRLRSTIDSFCVKIIAMDSALFGVIEFYWRSTATIALLNARAGASFDSPTSPRLFYASSSSVKSIRPSMIQLARSCAVTGPTNMFSRFIFRFMHFSLQTSANFPNCFSLTGIFKSLHLALKSSLIWSSSKTGSLRACSFFFSC